MTAEVYTRIKTLIESNEVWKITQTMLDLAKEVSIKLEPIEEVTPILFTEKIVFQTKKLSKRITVELGLESSKVNDSVVLHENTVGELEKILG